MTTDTLGGVWTFTQELTCGLLEQGCEVSLVSLGRAPAAGHIEWVSRMKSGWGRGFRFAAIETPLEWMQGNGHAFDEAGPSLLRLATDFEADVLHLNQFCFGALPTDVPKVVTAHSDVLSWAKACRGGALQDSEWLRQYCALVSAGLAEADAVTAPTRFMLEALAENFELPVQQCVIPNGRSVGGVGSKVRKLQAVTAGRFWDEAKNVTMLSDVALPMPLLLAGEASSEHGMAMPPLGHVQLIGCLSQNDLLVLFEESAVYVCTSRYEPFGLAPLEAALCGCAVVANDLPSLREVWGEAALYFSDKASLAELLERLYRDGEELAAAQERSRAQAQMYTRERMTCGYMELFEQTALDSHRRVVAHVA